MKAKSRFFEAFLSEHSALEIPDLGLRSLDQVSDFIRAYGFDLKNEADSEKLWDYYRRAISFISSELLTQGETIPEILANPEQLKDLSYLLIYASSDDSRPDGLKRWACAILKVMHVLAHADNDLFTSFSKEIQDQIVKPIQDYVFDDPVAGPSLTTPGDHERISLKKFEVKMFKSSESSILKLLAKREAIAFGILDKVGVRFVTKTLFDVFRVLNFLGEKNLVSFPHLVIGQTNNTLYPVNLFLEVMDSLPADHQLSSDEIDLKLKDKLVSAESRAVYLTKTSQFSSAEYRFVKFIARRLVRVQQGDKTLSFFYPYEVQLMDYETHLKNISGESSHEAYKDRQRQRARQRVLGVGP